MTATAATPSQPPRLHIFFIVWCGQLISLFGTRLTAFALGVWVYQHTGSATQFALIAVFTALPGILMLPLSGTLVGRWDRRLVMMLSDAGAGLCTLVIMILLMTELRLWHIYLILALSSMFESFQWPAYSASTTLLVPPKHYGRAAGMLPLARSISQTLAPLAGGVLYLTIGLAGVLLIDVLSFVMAIGTLALVRIPIPPKTRETSPGRRSFFRDVTYGWTYVLARPGLLALLGFFAVHNLLVGTISVLPTPLILSIGSVDTLGTVLAISAAGLFVGSLVMSAWGGPKPYIRGIFGACGIRGLCLIVAGLYPSAMLFAVAYGLSRLTLPIMNGCSQAIWQRKVAPDVQGRVFAIRKMIAFSSLPIAHFLAGPLADYVFEPLLAIDGPLAGSVGQVIGVGPGRGIGLIFILVGAAMVLKTAVGTFYPRLRDVEEELPDA